MKKALCAALALLFLFSSLSCGVKSEPYASYKDHIITQVMYKYWLAYYKTRFYKIMQEYGIITEESYTEDFWSGQISEGETFGDRVIKHVDGLVKDMLISAELYESLGLSSDADMKKTLENTVQSFVDSDIEAVGSRSELNKQLGLVGLNVSELKKIYEFEAKSLIVEDYLYGEDGVEKVTDAEKEEYYQNTYHRVKHVLIDVNKKYVKDSYGYPVMDTLTGYYKTEPLTEEEQAAARALGDSVYSSASAGADFEALIAEYNEDTGMASYPDGYFFTEQSAYDETFLNAVVSMKVGEVRMIESSYGLHIIKKYPLEAGMWGDSGSAAFFSDFDDNVKSAKKEKKYSEFYGDITVDEAFKGSLSPSDLPFLATALSDG